MLRLPLFAFIGLLLTGSSLFSNPTVKIEKTIVVSIAANGSATLGPVTIETDALARELQQRLWRTYLSSGLMPSKIQLHYNADVSETTRQEVAAAVKDGQEKTLNVFCLHKYKDRFEAISSRRKDRVKKQFPVLFNEPVVISNESK